MIWLLFPAGIVIAAIAIFTGLGGGVLWVPLLISVYHLEPRQAVLCALVIQVCGQTGGTLANLRQGLVNRNVLVQQLWFAIPACCAGTGLAAVVEPAYIQLGLGLLTFVIAYLFLRGETFLATGDGGPDLAAGRKVAPVTGLGGLLTGFVSVGVGDLVIPLFHRVTRLDMARSVATGVAMMLVLSATASACHLALGESLRWQLAAIAAPGVLLGGWIGSHLHRRCSETRFKELFVLLLVFLAAHVTFNAL